MNSAAVAWDDAAAGWDRHAPVIREWLHDATARMLDAACLRDGHRVLDVAAGAGDQTLDILQRIGRHGEVVVTDVSPTILALARARLNEFGARVRCVVADAEALALVGEDFDAAICRLGLMFCRSPGDALGAMLSVLRPGGRLAAIVFSTPQANGAVATLFDVAARYGAFVPGASPPPGSLFSLGAPGRLEGLLCDAGYEDVRVATLDAPFRLPCAADYVEFVRSSGSPIIELLGQLPADLQRAAWDEIGQRLDAFSTSGGWIGPNELLLASATRPAMR